ncbi:MAG TPA: DinB family protein [Phaeodactylibacter sp.]|nr:DinB family protein [Phaeodactylibacter sp.]
MITKKKPLPNEYAPNYYIYVSKVTSSDFIEKLKELKATTLDFLAKLSEEQWNTKYEEGKWSVKEVVMHMIDTERIFAYRALRISRNDMTPMAGFEQDGYVPYYQVDQRSPASILAEYKAVRNATLHLFQNFTDENMNRIGVANGVNFSVRALGFIIVGHEMHHREVLKEKYF